MDYKQIWKKTDEDLKSSLPAHAYEAWIETLSPVGITNDIFIVEAPNQFAYDWIINNYQDITKIHSFQKHTIQKKILQVHIKQGVFMVLWLDMMNHKRLLQVYSYYKQVLLTHKPYKKTLMA